MSSPNLSPENVRKSQEISIDFEKVAVKAVQSFIIGSFYGFYAGSRSLNLPENCECFEHCIHGHNLVYFWFSTCSTKTPS
jgi:hypothetical protein